MKKWQTITAAAMALVMAVSIPLSAMAKSPDEAAAARPPLKGALAIVAPRHVPEGKEMSLGVFQRDNQEPVTGAGVWALTREKAASLEKDKTLKDNIVNGEDAEHESILSGIGIFLGRTAGDGRIHHTFDNAGSYVLIAAKKNYVPDFSPLLVTKPAAARLVITAPRVSPPGSPVTIKVTENSGDAVKDAGVWALTKEKAEAVKSQITANRTNETAVDAESVLNSNGTFLGKTNGNGELKHTFDNTGVYVLVTFKQGFLPGYAVLTVKEAPKALSVNAPRTAEVGDNVAIKVTQRGTGEPVKDAGVWALTPAEAETLRASTTANTTTTANIESVIAGHGIFIGRTNGDGQVHYKFETAGKYVLVSAKNGYTPAYTTIGIVSHDTKTPVKPNAPAAAKPDNGRGNNTTAEKR